MNRDQAIALGLIKIPEQPLPELYWQQCARKIAHRNWDAAFQHAIALATSSPMPDKKLSVYCCPWGKHFHVGHKTVIDWNSYVTRKDYTSLYNKFTILTNEADVLRRERSLLHSKYNRKLHDYDVLLSQVVTNAAPISILAPIPDKYPRINKFLAKFNLKLSTERS